MSFKLREVDCPIPVEGNAFIYILQSADGSLYVGRTCNVRERLKRHKLGRGAKHTRDRTALRLVYWEGPITVKNAVSRESQLKRWSRSKKEALIMGERGELRMLSRSQEAAG